MYIVVYNGINDKTITRLHNTIPFVSLNSFNGYGWYVVTVQQLYNKSFYTNETVLFLIDKEHKLIEKRKSRIEKIIKVIDIILN